MGDKDLLCFSSDYRKFSYKENLLVVIKVRRVVITKNGSQWVLTRKGPERTFCSNGHVLCLDLSSDY